MWRGKTRPAESPSTCGASGKETGSEKKLCKGKNVCNKSASSNFSLVPSPCFIVFTVTHPFSFVFLSFFNPSTPSVLAHFTALTYLILTTTVRYNDLLQPPKVKLREHKWLFQMFYWSSATSVWMRLWLGECKSVVNICIIADVRDIYSCIKGFIKPKRSFLFSSKLFTTIWTYP